VVNNDDFICPVEFLENLCGVRRARTALLYCKFLALNELLGNVEASDALRAIDALERTFSEVIDGLHQASPSA